MATKRAINHANELRAGRAKRMQRNMRRMRTLFSELETLHREIAARLEDTARGLRSGEVNTWRAANRLDEVVRQITGNDNGKGKDKERT